MKSSPSTPYHGGIDSSGDNNLAAPLASYPIPRHHHCSQSASFLDRRRFLQTSAALAFTAAGLNRSLLALEGRDDFDELYTRSVDRAIEQGLANLLSRQNDDGSFRSSRWGRNVAVCGLSGLAMLSRGLRPGEGVYGNAVRKIGQFILEAAQSSGFISIEGTTSHGPMYDHGFATLFLAELYGLDTSLAIRERLAAAIDLILRTQNNQGGWRYDPRPFEADLSVTVCQLMALRAARNAGIFVPNETVTKALDYVRRSQNPDGGYMYQLSGSESRFALTAAAIVALNSGGVYEGKDIEDAFEYLEGHFNENRSIQRNTYFFYAHYYSVQAFWIHGKEPWKSWYTRVRDLILRMQNDDGSWFDHSSQEYGTAMACLILNMPRTVLPIFQR